MNDKIANMGLEEYLKLSGMDYLDNYEVLTLKTFIELKLANLENKFLKPVLQVDCDVIGNIDKYNKIATGLWRENVQRK